MTDFWRDLQAWTQAQYDARVRSAALRRNNLAADINKLLRDRLSYRLTIKDGTAIGAEFLRTAGRIAPPIPLVPLPMESGWLTFEDRGSGELPYVYTYSPTGLAKYTIIPDGIDLDGYDSYESGYTRASYTPPIASNNLCRHRPERYSGLMRLCVQALIGANRVVEELLGYPAYSPIPSANNLLPQRLGLMRSPAGVYWVVYFYQSGTQELINCRRLRIPAAASSDAAEVRDWVGNMSANDANYLEAYVLSRLIYDTSASYLNLIPNSDTTWQKTFEAGYSFMPWGICWRSQSRGASDEHTSGAVWTVRKQTSTSSPSGIVYAQTFRRHTLDITWTGATPSASVSSEDLGTIVFDTDRGAQRVYLTDATTINELFPFSTYYSYSISSDSPVVDVLSWYGSDGDLHKISAYRKAPAIIDQNISETLGVGVDQDYSSAYYLEQSTPFFGWKFDGADLINISTYRGMTLNDQTTSATATETSRDFAYVYADINGINSSIYEATKSAVSALIISDIPGVAWLNVLGCGIGVHEETTSSTGPYTHAVGSTLPDPENVIWYEWSPTGFTLDSEATTETGERDGYLVFISDSSVIATNNQSASDDVLAWLGTKTEYWDRQFAGAGFTSASPAVVLDFMPAIGGYNAVREMYGDGLTDKFDARAYGYLGRLIGGA